MSSDFGLYRSLPSTSKPEEVGHVHMHNFLYGDFHMFLASYIHYNRELNVINSSMIVLVTTS